MLPIMNVVIPIIIVIVIIIISVLYYTNSKNKSNYEIRSYPVNEIISPNYDEYLMYDPSINNTYNITTTESSAGPIIYPAYHNPDDDIKSMEKEDDMSAFSRRVYGDNDRLSIDGPTIGHKPIMTLSPDHYPQLGNEENATLYLSGREMCW